MDYVIRVIDAVHLVRVSCADAAAIARAFYCVPRLPFVFDRILGAYFVG